MLIFEEPRNLLPSKISNLTHENLYSSKIRQYHKIFPSLPYVRKRPSLTMPDIICVHMIILLHLLGFELLLNCAYYVVRMYIPHPLQLGNGAYTGIIGMNALASSPDFAVTFVCCIPCYHALYKMPEFTITLLYEPSVSCWYARIRCKSRVVQI